MTKCHRLGGALTVEIDVSQFQRGSKRLSHQPTCCMEQDSICTDRVLYTSQAGGGSSFSGAAPSVHPTMPVLHQFLKDPHADIFTLKASSNGFLGTLAFRVYMKAREGDVWMETDKEEVSSVEGPWEGA